MSDQDANANTEAPNTSDGAVTQSDLDKLLDQLKSIKAEDGRQQYASLDKALESIVHKDAFIDTLKKENAEEKDLRKNLSEEIEQLKAKLEMEKTVSTEFPLPAKEERPSTDKVDEKNLADLVAEQVAALSNKKTKDDNFSQFKSAVNLGDEQIVAYMDEKAKAIGLSTSFLKDIIQQNPSAAMKLLEGTDIVSPEKTPSTIRTESVDKASMDTLQLSRNGRPSFGRSSAEKAGEIAALRKKYTTQS